MSHELALVFLGFAAFQVKHFICDYILQTRYQFSNKGFYGHPGGLLHTGLHGLASIPALLVFTRSPATIGIIVVAEMVVHYHTDWLKETIDRTMKWTYSDAAYWWVFGADQLVHQLTYLAIIVIMATGMFGL